MPIGKVSMPNYFPAMGLCLLAKMEPLGDTKDGRQWKRDGNIHDIHGAGAGVDSPS